MINLVGILQESGRQSFSGLQAEGPRLIAEAAAPDARIVHVSAIGADPASDSAYARTKAEGEAGLLAARLRDHAFGLVLTSPLSRARETAELPPDRFAAATSS